MNRTWRGSPVDPSTLRRRTLRLLTTRGVLPVRVCQRCAALVLGAGLDQHERAHHADAQGARNGA